MTRKKSTPTSNKASTRRPMADKVIKKMLSHVGARVVDLSAVMEGKKNAQALQKTVASAEYLADLHPAHAIYVYAQNQASVMAEPLTIGWQVLSSPALARSTLLKWGEYQPDWDPTTDSPQLPPAFKGTPCPLLEAEKMKKPALTRA
ncbi:hypothetical protein [Ectothiorhodospira variabilis]|uniref:hypothetical protein n=1 Tax=Ectothiorhodospira variabilis TaxID=505694 RepID=UPI001EFB2870|nr:hypothetical protein [Ectothiorhodospira variabilis]MCG5495033.1 hypothetical protein [Ectothiorhodospira variabilis]MCG5504620.1 hypothetical protein [Ectothiorhodospira variabilis]MCG5507827.1 hypothetical protein [Ectothiorhodospira variabilis]